MIIAIAAMLYPADEAQASEPFIGQISWFGGNFAPRGWALCDGQLLPISQYQALFSILGTTYGGDGRTTFGLPDMRGRLPMHPGNGPGLSPRRLGDKGGEERVTITQSNLPSHRHSLLASTEQGDSTSPSGAFIGPAALPLQGAPEVKAFKSGTPNTSALAGGTVSHTGGGIATNNLQPYQSINCIIALVGVFPSRN